MSAESEIGYRALTGRLGEKAALGLEDEAHLQLRIILYGPAGASRTNAVLQRRLAALDNYVAEHGHTKVPKRHVEGDVNLGEAVKTWRSSYAKGTMEPSLVVVLEGYTGWVWNLELRTSIDAYLAVLDRYVAEHGDARVPQSYVEGNLRLGKVISDWRRQYGENKFSPERIARLESYPGWVWHARTAAAEDHLAALDRYVAEHGNSSVPREHLEGDVKLGSIVRAWRRKYVVGELPSELITALEAHPGWTWSVHAAATKGNLEALTRFVEVHGHAVVPYGYSDSDVRLGIIVNNWRASYRANNLPPELIAALESHSGWLWDVNSAAVKNKLAALDSFVEAHGHARVPNAHTEGDIKLGSAVSKWRQLYRNNKLSPDVLTALESRPGWVWSTRSAL